MKKALCFLSISILIPQFAFAVITFQQLDGNTFTVSHKVKVIGSRGQAMDLVYEKASSLCIAAGYSHLKILDQESNANGYNQAANATLTVKFFTETGEGRVACDGKASDKYIKQAKEKLTKKGYEGPIATVDSDSSQETENHCTVEQISAMVKAGLGEDQIKAACSEEN